MGAKWTYEELEFLRENYSEYGPQYCVEVLGRTKEAVKQKAKSLKVRAPSRRKTHEKYISELPKGIEVLEKYATAIIKILHKHTLCGSTWMARPNDILNGYGCPICGGSMLKTTEQYIAQLPKDIELIEKSYKGAHTPILHKHKNCGNEWLVTPDNILHRDSSANCPSCAVSGFNINKPATLYYICINSKYYKIGITNKTINDRFSKEKDVTIKIIWEKLFDKGYEAFEAEKTIKKEFKNVLGLHSVLKHSGNTEIADHDFLQLDTVNE